MLPVQGRDIYHPGRRKASWWQRSVCGDSQEDHREAQLETRVQRRTRAPVTVTWGAHNYKGKGRSGFSLLPLYLRDRRLL